MNDDLQAVNESAENDDTSIVGASTINDAVLSDDANEEDEDAEDFESVAEDDSIHSVEQYFETEHVTNGFSSVVSPGTSHSCGSAILFRPCFSLIRSWTDSDGRFVMAEFQRHGLTFRVVSLYAPNRNPQRDDLFSYRASMVDPSVPTLVCGDFNAVFDRALDRRGSNVFDASRESVRALGALFSDCCIVNAWRALHPSTVAFSWLGKSKKIKCEAYNTGYSQVVTHPSTNPARQGLTSVIRRERCFPCGMVVDERNVLKF